MKITSISQQARDPNRVNVSIDGKYSFSLDVFQLVELGLKVGQDYDEGAVDAFRQESDYGKLYARALDYCAMRPHSEKEVRDYLWRKTRATKTRSRKTGEVKDKPGVSPALAERVLTRLKDKGYIDDMKFATYWVENRSQAKGASRRKLVAELRAKGVGPSIIEAAIENSSRQDEDELAKVIAKKRSKYQDDQKFVAYLARQGFDYDDIKSALGL